MGATERIALLLRGTAAPPRVPAQRYSRQAPGSLYRLSARRHDHHLVEADDPTHLHTALGAADSRVQNQTARPQGGEKL